MAGSYKSSGGGERFARIGTGGGPEGSYMSRKDGFENIDTIEKLFAYMRQELETGKILEVKYDKKTGYPKDVSIRHTYNNSHGSRSIHISKLEALQEIQGPTKD